jgi:hypothetical protein
LSGSTSIPHTGSIVLLPVSLIAVSKVVMIIPPYSTSYLVDLLYGKYHTTLWYSLLST